MRRHVIAAGVLPGAFTALASTTTPSTPSPASSVGAPEQVHIALGRGEGEMTVSWATLTGPPRSSWCTQDGGQACPGWMPPDDRGTLRRTKCLTGCAVWNDLAGSGNTHDQAASDAKFANGTAPARGVCAMPAHDNSGHPWCYCAGVNSTLYGYCTMSTSQCTGPGQPPPLRWGEKGSPLDKIAHADTRPLNVYGCRNTHVATMSGLVAGREYTYQVGDAKRFDFTYKRERPAGGEPGRHIIFGDLGASQAHSLCPPCTYKDECNCTGNASAGVVSEVGDADMVLHVGDFAYDLAGVISKGGDVGDQFMRNIEQVAARVPYMVGHGNHEDTPSNLAHYIERFRGMPGNAEPATVATAAGTATNSLYYSWDQGLVHYVAVSTELAAGLVEESASVNRSSQLAWFEKDLQAANANRKAVPWIVAHGHRGVYCSDTGCGRPPTPQLSADFEPLLFKYGVDFWINGHEHNYERTYPMYKGNSTRSNVNARATVYVTTGAAGSHEMHEAFTQQQPTWSAFRSNSFGYSRMLVHNASHLHWQQVQTDPTLFPGSEYGRVIDDVWYVQDRHGPFAASEAPQGTAFAADDASATREHDHWAPLLGITAAPGQSTSAAVRAWRAAHGDRAWAAKEDRLLRWANARLRSGDRAVWEDVRGDGSSDGAWFTWRGGAQ